MCAHFGYVTCSVRVCTDLLSWMAGRGAGAGRLPSDHLGDRLRSNNTFRERRQHSEKCVQQKLTPLKCCARPSSMEHFKCPSGSRTPSSVPRAAGHPILATAKMQKKKALVFHRSLHFRPNFPKTRAAIGDHTIKWKICFFCPFWEVFF